MKYKICLILLFLVSVIFYSCKKEPGKGGNATIYGKVYVKDYNATFTVLQEEYYGQDIWVYIIYGDDRDYGDRIRTGYDGVYEFKYLRPGKYQIYTYSKDSTIQTNAMIPVIKNVEIKKNNDEMQVPDLVIFN
ncbi:MAG: hypothetical protein HY958_01710 [Bacteroidia bacterium]|nr:hypothetical protein [Bacteroidia bacterium]